MIQAWRHFGRLMNSLHPVRLVALGYLSYILIGWGLLSLPVSTTGDGLPVLDRLFTSASAVSTTGLVTASTGNDFTRIGQLVILVLIQLGGIGYMTFGSFVALSESTTLSEKRQRIGKTVFSMPEEFKVDKFIRSVIIFTVLVEVVGAVALYVAFIRDGVADPVWSAIFHSVSAFCTAGFSLYDDNFQAFRGNVAINTILGILCYLGAMGFIVFIDVWRCMLGRTKRLTLTSITILTTTLAISMVGVALFFMAEESITHLPLGERIMAAVFQVMTSITTVGFNTVPTAKLSAAALFVVLLLMIIGASPSGTGGGLKTTTFTALFGQIMCSMRGQQDVTFWGKEIPDERLRVAVATIGFYLLALFTGSYVLMAVEDRSFTKLLFESTSALGTVGLSMGITGSLSQAGKLIIITMMFIGRLGPLVFGIALFSPPRKHTDDPEEDLAV